MLQLAHAGKKWLKHFEMYLAAHDAKDATHKRVLLLYSAGEEVSDIFETLLDRRKEKDYVKAVTVSGTLMLILLLFWTVIYSLQFKIIEPSVLFGASGFCHLQPASLARIEGPRAFVKWHCCVMLPIFSSETFVQVYLSLHGAVPMFRTAKDEQQHMYEQCEV